MSNDSSRSQRRNDRRQHPDNTRHHITFVYRPAVLPAKVNNSFPPTNNDDNNSINTKQQVQQKSTTPSISIQDKAYKMKLAETTSRKEALLKLPETQSREIFSAYALFEQSVGRHGSPLVNLPDPGKAVIGTRMGQGPLLTQRPGGQCGTDDDESDDTDVEEDLFIKLEQELNNSDDAATRRRLAVTKEHHHHHHQSPVDASTISLPQSVFTFPSDGYFSPGASFISSAEPPVAATTPQATTDLPPDSKTAATTSATTKSSAVLDHGPPTINVRIVGGEVIMSPAQEHVLWAAPASTPENVQTRSDEEILYGTHPFSLRPPPHLSRSRRTSRINPQQQPAIGYDRQNLDGPETRSHASSRNSSTSAVSPRFMALRKLSESGLIPTPSDLNSPDQQLLHKIEEILEVKLKASVSEIMWRATESRQDSQRYWEEQKQEILDIGLSILKRLDEQSPSSQQQQSTSEGSDKPNEKEELDLLRKERIDLENEMATYRLKQIEQSTELEEVKKQNALLMKRSDMSSGGDNSDERLVEIYAKRIEALEDQIRQLKQEPKGDDKERLCAVDAELQTDPDDKGTIKSTSNGSSESRADWADVMGGESEWEKKYRELEARYAQERPELEQKITALEKKLKHKSYTPMTTTTAAAAMTTSYVDRVQHQDRQRKYKSMTSTFPSSAPRKQQGHYHRQSYYMNEAGQLTFTTEINGRLSQYTVKLPTKESNNNTTNTTTTTANTTGSRLNPNAQPFKASI